MTDAADASRQASRSLAAAATVEQGRPFVGRVQELRELRAALEEAAARQGCLLLVTGEPGIGKSRLMEELARQLPEQGWRVLVGRCWEHGGAPAYWPWMQVVRAAGSELLECLPSAPTAADPEAARFQLFDAVGRFLRKVAGSGPVLVVLDDLHAADEPSLLLLRFLAQTVTDERVVLVGAYRDAEPRVHELAGLFGDLARVGHRVRLRGLSHAEVGGYMLRVAGRPPPGPVVARVHDVTAGNPLFVGEVVRALLVGGDLGTAEGRGSDPMLRIPEELRGLIHRRLAGLSTEAVSNLKVASVVGREFELGVLRRISRLRVGRLTEALAEAERVGLVSGDASTPGRYAFSHELVREALYDDLPAARRLKLHHTIGLVLEEAFRDDLEPHLAELAHHFTRSATLGDAALAVEYSTRAGDHAAALLAYEDAARHYARALHLLPMLKDTSGDRRCVLLLRLGDVQWRTGDTEQAGRSFEEAAALSDRLGAGETLARAALGYVTAGAPLRLGLGGLILTGTFGEETTGIRRLEQALAALPEGDSSLRAQVLARLATELYPTGQADRRTALAEEAVAMARRLGDLQALLVALHGRHWATLSPDHIDVRLANATEMLDVAARVGDEEMAFLARHARLHGFLELCEVGRVDAELEAMALTADHIRQPFYQWHIASMRAMRALLDGRLDEAERLARSTLDAGLRPSVHMTYMYEHALMLAIRWQQGRLGERRETVRAHGDQYPSIARWRDALAAAELADERAARAEIERHARSGFADLPRDGLWILHLCALAEACVLIRDQQRAGQLYDLLSPYAERNAIPLSTVPFGPVALRLGMLAAMLERWGEAERHFEAATERCSRLGARAVIARVLYERSRMLLARGAGGDHASAVELLGQAEAICRELDLPGIAERVAALAASAAQPGRGDSTEPAAGAVFRREGEYWTLAYRGELARLRDAKGLGYLACLLRHPGRELHVLELVREVEGAVAAGPAPSLRRADVVTAGLAVSRLDGADPLVDVQAREAYRRRLRELEEDLEEAHSWSDPERAARAEAEIDALTAELAGAAGLGGRHRTLAMPAERARVSVTKATRSAIRTVARHCPALGDHLAASVRTGRFCSYAPPGEAPPAWSF
jgi:tetratricopeptide (TPR) repeat protein